ncbi:hypothetical protein JCM14469_35630 [Desulfatiferula olefinivorans]
MSPYPGPSTNLMVLSLLLLCAAMVAYGLFRLYRITSAARHRDSDPVSMQMLLEGIREATRSKDETPGTALSDEVLKTFYEDVNPPDQRYLH